MIFSIFIRCVLDNVSGKTPRRYQEQMESANQLGLTPGAKIDRLQ